MKYYLTIEKDGQQVVANRSYDDYAAALAACSDYYAPNFRRSVLTFTCEVINGQFARSYAELNSPDSIDASDQIGSLRYAAAVKTATAFEYSGSYFFLIESDLGIEDKKSFLEDDEDELE